ncbi:MAG: hypothetical protein ACE5GX_13445 [Thermoanaerobaculia bacterium]
MTTIQTLALLFLAALPLVETARNGFDPAPEPPVVLALLSEGLELCRGDSGNPIPEAGTAASTARLAAAREAVELAVELSARFESTELRSAMRRLAGLVAAQCAPGEDRQPPSQDLAVTDRELHRRLIEPFMPGLSEAALSAVDGWRQDGSEASVRAGRPAAQPTADAKDRVPKIEIRIGASAAHRERVAAWSPLFRREAGALRVARRALQVEIENYSLLEARRACRSFGRVVERIDPRLESSAPSRELGRRLERMLDRYRKGAAECVAGRSASAYSYLSEGDREWVSLVREAARVIRPEPLRAVTGPADAAPGGARSTPGH